jgi:hypothetical protein
MYTLNNAVTGQLYAQGLGLSDLGRAMEYARVLSQSLIHPVAIRMNGGTVVATALKGRVETVEDAVAQAIEDEVEADLEDAWAASRAQQTERVMEPEPEPAMVEVSWEKPARPKPVPAIPPILKQRGRPKKVATK